MLQPLDSVERFSAINARKNVKPNQLKKAHILKNKAGKKMYDAFIQLLSEKKVFSLFKLGKGRGEKTIESVIMIIPRRTPTPLF